MKSRVILVLLFMGNVQLVFGQFSMEEFLGSARDDLSLNPSRAKLDFLKENNFNAVRTSHYPNDSRFYELCD